MVKIIDITENSENYIHLFFSSDSIQNSRLNMSLVCFLSYSVLGVLDAVNCLCYITLLKMRVKLLSLQLSHAGSRLSSMNFYAEFWLNYYWTC